VGCMTGISGTSRSAKLLDEESGSWGVELEGASKCGAFCPRCLCLLGLWCAGVSEL
jgi:hypothetical protein